MMSLPEQSNSGRTVKSNFQAAAPTPILERFLDAVCHAHRETPGNVLVEVRIGVWAVMVPLSELYGVADKLRLQSSS